MEGYTRTLAFDFEQWFSFQRDKFLCNKQILIIIVTLVLLTSKYQVSAHKLENRPLAIQREKKSKQRVGVEQTIAILF